MVARKTTTQKLADEQALLRSIGAIREGSSRLSPGYSANPRDPTPTERRTASLRDLNDNQLVQKFESDLETLRGRVESFFNAGGAPATTARSRSGTIGGRPSSQAGGYLNTGFTRSSIPALQLGETVRQFQRDVVAAGSGRTSGFSAYNSLLGDARDLILRLSPSGTLPGPSVGALRGPTGAQGPTRQNTRSQLVRDARVSARAADQRNAITSRRNRQLTPGSSSDLRQRANTIFAGSRERRGALT